MSAMEDMIQSTIAQLLFSGESALNFAKIVGELQGVLSRRNPDTVRIAWDHDDLVVFDLDECRILLSWNDVSGNGFGGCLSVAVGPSAPDRDSDADYQLEVLCSRLVERIQNRFNPLVVLWRQVDGMVDSERIDALIDRLPRLAPVIAPIDSVIDTVARTDLSKAAEPSETVTSYRRADGAEPRFTPRAEPGATSNQSPAGPHVAANDQPVRLHPARPGLSRVRIALYPQRASDDASDAAELPPQTSVQMRLAVHAMNATLIFVWLPFGAAVTTYSILAGANVRLSARLMAISGTALAVSQPHVWQMVIHMAGA
jgi:hypothetical protein